MIPEAQAFAQSITRALYAPAGTPPADKLDGRLDLIATANQAAAAGVTVTELVIELRRCGMEVPA